MIRPAHEPRTGTPVRLPRQLSPAPTPARRRRGSAKPSRSMPNVIVVDSPPGITRPSNPSRSAGNAHLAHARTQPLQNATVRLEVALQGKHAD